MVKALIEESSKEKLEKYVALFKLVRNFSKIKVVCAVNYLHNLDYKTRQMEIYWIYHTSIRGNLINKGNGQTSVFCI